MAKRFIDSSMWETPEFLEATPKQKLLAIYMVSKCDHAGVFRASLPHMNMMLGFVVTDEDILSIPMDVVIVKENSYWLVRFCQHQYGPLKSKSYPHRRIAETLSMHGLLSKVAIDPASDFSALLKKETTLPTTLPTRVVTTPEDEDEDEDSSVSVLGTKANTKNTVPARARKDIPNSAQEMVDYGAEIGLAANECDKAFDFYASKGWKVGSAPMKDWKAAIRNWKRGVDEKKPTTTNPQPETIPQLAPGDEKILTKAEIEDIRRMVTAYCSGGLKLQDVPYRFQLLVEHHAIKRLAKAKEAANG